MDNSRVSWLSIVITVPVFLAAGIASSYSYACFNDHGGAWLPGIIFTSAMVVALIICKIQFGLRPLLLYYLSMTALYVGVYFLTLITSWFVVIGGLFTSAIGSMGTYLLTDKFLVKFDFEMWIAFLAGVIAFGLTEIVQYSSDLGLIEKLLGKSPSIETMFSDIFVFWQTLVGTTLMISIRKNKVG